jgi:superoxide dismutase, Cu-Zn family
LIIQVSQGEIVARFRKTVVAAVALSALALTTTVAYARDHGLNGDASESSTALSMRWAHYSGELTDLSPKTDDVYDGARATAVMIGMNNESTFRVTIRALKAGAIHQEYGAHLHTGPCGLDAAGNATVGGHYNTTPTGLPPVVNDKTEVWLNFHVNSDRYARATAIVPFVPDGHERSITFHEKATVHHGAGVGTAGLKLACLPLDIKEVAGSS